MEELTQYDCPNSAEISAVVREIDGLFHGARIYLFSYKLGRDHAVASFKLCVIYDFADKAEAERAVYLDIDCDVPFDVVLYTPAEWEHLSCQPGSFACRVSRTGFAVHEEREGGRRNGTSGL